MEVHSRALRLDAWTVGGRLREGTAESREVDYEAVLLEHLDFVERTVGAIARRNALSAWEADDLEGQVKLRLISNDYAILRKFEGKSRLTTYLTTVIQNLFRDFRIQQWGKWRPSAAAKRLGDVGVQLESLLYRDRFSFGEAAELLRNRFGVQASDEELLELGRCLKPRTTRRFESDRVLSSLSAPEHGDQRVVDGERSASQERVGRALAGVLASLEAEDRLILKLRFADGLTIRSVADTLHLDPRGIYARVRRILRTVRARLVEAGIECQDVLDLLEWPACTVRAGLSDDVEPLERKSA